MTYHESLRQAVDWLVQNGAPVVAFGQTVFWDEPMKVILLNAIRERAPDLSFTMGIHDVDYFSKLPQRHPTSQSETFDSFALVGRNDGSTRDLWAAVAEAAVLFGGETPLSVSEFHRLNFPFRCMASLAHEGEVPFIDKYTEAWGWRALAYTGADMPVACEISLTKAIQPLRRLFEWALNESVELVEDGPSRSAASTQRERLIALLDEAAAFARDDPDPSDCPAGQESVSCFYQRLLPRILEFVSGQSPAAVAISSTFQHFQFNQKHAARSRFAPAQLFIDPATRETCLHAYNLAVERTGIYAISRFGEGAIPFDVVAPGFGRATLRIVGNRVFAQSQKGDSLIGTLSAFDLPSLAAIIESRFSAGAALVGKALMLPVMLCSEAVMVLSETASAYMSHTQKWVREIASAGIELNLKPLLRLRYSTFDSLSSINASFRLPSHIRRTLGGEVIQAADLAHRWQSGLEEQREFLNWLELHSGVDDLLAWLGTHDPSQAAQWMDFRNRLIELRHNLRKRGERIDEWRASIFQLETERIELAATIREIESVIGRLRDDVEAGLPGAEAQQVKRREALQHREAVVAEIRRIRREQTDLADEIKEEMSVTKSERIRERKREIERSVQQQRLQLAHDALLFVRGMARANLRPCAWWLRLIDPSGRWFNEVAGTTQARFEHWLESSQKP